MLSDDELDRMLRDSDPAPDESPTDPDSPTAAGILARVRRSARQRRRRIMIMAPAVALTVAGVTAGTYAWVAGDGRGHTLDSTGLTCDGPQQGDAVVGFDPGTDDPVRTCRQQWQEMFGQPAPGTLTACVDSSRQGSIVVYAGGRDQCGRHRADPYLGPTREQLGLSLFRAGIKEHFAGRTCVPYSEFRKVVGQLLAKHDLTGWKSGHLQSAAKEPEGACAEISYYDEPEKTIWLGDHTAGDPLPWP
ncbi:hypothetical protein [Streptomyces xylophagus]|uniref:hypothetical protein n=1 Tax=Streptomyces xylophagus TaxID=285514 RepID=UPI0005BDFA42|nr:hypothetical protein [Streptomyces xylophagus]